MKYSFTPGVFPSVNTHTDWLTSRALPSKTINDIKPIGGIGDFQFKIKDQGQLPYCTGMGAYIQEFWQAKETGKYSELSAMFVYRMNKRHDGLPPGTEGSTAKATMDTLRLFGVCQGILYPSNQGNYDGPIPTDEKLMSSAFENRILSYTRNPTLDEILISLDGSKPVGFSMFLLSDFFRTTKGRVPKEIGGSFVGGHFMVATNYNIDQEIVKVVQSWGTAEPTLNGYMEIPFTWFRYVIEDLGFPLLMDAYTALDYIPPKELVLPKYLTVGDRIPTIEVNGQIVKTSDAVFAFIGSELGRTLVSVRTIEEILNILTGKPAQVSFDQDTWTVKINI